MNHSKNNLWRLGEGYNNCPIQRYVYIVYCNTFIYMYMFIPVSYILYICCLHIHVDVQKHIHIPISRSISYYGIFSYSGISGSTRATFMDQMIDKGYGMGMCCCPYPTTANLMLFCPPGCVV